MDHWKDEEANDERLRELVDYERACKDQVRPPVVRLDAEPEVLALGLDHLKDREKGDTQSKDQKKSYGCHSGFQRILPKAKLRTDAFVLTTT